MTNATKVDLATPEVEIDRIHVVEDRNPRGWVDPTELVGLIASIEDIGVIEPIGIEPDGEGDFNLRYGERRLRAARAAGLKTIPVTLNGRDVSRAAAAENDHRQATNPIAKARGWSAVAAEHNLTKVADIAEAVRFTPSVVGAHLRLLKLPEGVQRHIAEGLVPMTAEPQLRAVAKVSPRIAECVCELAKRRKVEPSRFAGQFADLLCEAAEARFQDPPTMIPTVRVAIADAVADKDAREQLVARIAELFPDLGVDATYPVTFSEEEIDAARAAGCLLEVKPKAGEWARTIRYITDADFAADLADRAIERIVADTVENRRRLEEHERKAKAEGQGVDPDATPDEQSEERKAQAAERRRLKAEAESSNEEVGRRLIKARGRRAQKQRAMVRLRTLGEMFVEAYPDLAGRGLRLVLPQLREVESKPTKAGKPREKITYASPAEASAYFLDRLSEAKTPEEGIELLTQLVVAAHLADEHAVPQAERLDHRVRVSSEAQKALAAEIKAATPPARGSKK